MDKLRCRNWNREFLASADVVRQSGSLVNKGRVSRNLVSLSGVTPNFETTRPLLSLQKGRLIFFLMWKEILTLLRKCRKSRLLSRIFALFFPEVTGHLSNLLVITKFVCKIIFFDLYFKLMGFFSLLFQVRPPL